MYVTAPLPPVLSSHSTSSPLHHPTAHLFLADSSSSRISGRMPFMAVDLTNQSPQGVCAMCSVGTSRTLGGEGRG